MKALPRARWTRVFHKRKFATVAQVQQTIGETDSKVIAENDRRYVAHGHASDFRLLDTLIKNSSTNEMIYHSFVQLVQRALVIRRTQFAYLPECPVTMASQISSGSNHHPRGI
jgi:hypothetical protein